MPGDRRPPAEDAAARAALGEEGRPRWWRSSARTLYGIVIYNNRRVNFGRVDPAAAREIFIREALVGGEWETKLPFLAHNRKLIAQVEELEHKSRRQDVLVDDELIYAFYDQQIARRRVQRRDASSAGTATRCKRQPQAAAADARRADAPRGRRHHDRGVPEDDPPGRHRLRGELPARAGRREGRRHGHGADLRAEPGERRALRMAGAGHAEGQGARAGEEPAPAAALAAGAAARLRGRRSSAQHAVRAGQPARRAAEGRARRTQLDVQRARLQARAAAAASVHELARRRRARPAARHGAQPRGAEGRARRAGALGVPGAGGVEGAQPSPAAAPPLRGSAEPSSDDAPRSRASGRGADAAAARGATPPGPSASCPS